MAVLYFFSRKEELPEGVEETGISRAFLKMSLFIYKRIKGRMRSFSSEKIRRYLGTLRLQKDLDRAETEYFIRKISIVLIMATAGSFLSITTCVAAGRSGHITEDGRIVRGSFGDREYDISLTARDEEGKELLDHAMTVTNRVYTEEEAEALFEEASPLLEKIVLKENPSPDQVTGDLDLTESIDGYPFVISWKMDNYEVIHQDGALKEENIPPEGVLVNLTATISYEECKWQQLFCVNVLPRRLTPGEKAFKEIKEMLHKADADSKTEESILLPQSYNGSDLIWTEKITDNSFLLLMLTLIGGVASYVLKDKELKQKVEERNRQMLMDYPQFVSQLVLYMGAGMTVRNIILKLSESYAAKRRNGEEKRYLYEELMRAGREMSTGSSEGEVYERLGLRCGGQQYTRLVTLLSQNLRRGNSELLALLQEESKKAFDERMDKARKAGEEAGTKLLLPMIIMLLIVMIVIMIPAYMAF